MVTALYRSILEEVLRSPLKVGQAGRWEATPEMSYVALASLEASLTAHLGNEIKATYSAPGKEIVREAAARYGRYRGECMRRDVELKGLPLDLPTMWKWWDLPVTAARAGERINDDCTPEFNGFEVETCAFAQVYEAVYDPELRAMHCEAMHKAAFTGFNPSIDNWFVALMPRGDARCLFRLRLPPAEAEKAALRATVRDLPRGPDDLATAYHLLVRQIAIIYHFFSTTLLERVGPAGAEAVLRRAAANWGTYRGRTMQSAHLALGWPLDLEHFVTYYDEPSAGEAWLAQNVRLTPADYHVEITWAPLAEWFKTLATGRRAAILLEEALPAQARAYNPGITLTMPRLKERGDSVTELHYVLDR